MNGRLVLGDLNPLVYYFGIASLLGLLFALILPDSDAPFLLILLQWQFQSNIPMAMMLGVLVLINRLGILGRANGWQKLLISGAIGATLFVPVALTIDIMLGEALDDLLWLELVNEWIGVVPPVVICWVVINIPWMVGFSLNKSTDIKPVTGYSSGTENNLIATEQSSQNSALEKGFMRHLLKTKKGDVLYVKAELHYVSIVRERGQDLVLYSLKDLAQEIPPSIGIPVHRSYWVTLSGIDFYQSKGRQGELHMLNGDIVPVSRACKAKVESIWTELKAKNKSLLL